MRAFQRVTSGHSAAIFSAAAISAVSSTTNPPTISRVSLASYDQRLSQAATALEIPLVVM